MIKIYDRSNIFPRVRPGTTEQFLISVYEKYNDLTKTSKELGVSIEAIRKFFINTNFKYRLALNYNLNHNFFGTDTEKSFYWAGFIAADACISKTKHRLAIVLKQSDIVHLEKFKTDIGSEAPIYKISRSENRPGFLHKIYYSCSLRMTSKTVCSDLKRFNIVPNKSLTYTIPESIQDHELFPHFIRGMIDGDGHVSHSGQHGVIYLCGTKNTISVIRKYFISKLGAKVSKITSRKNKGKGSLYFFACRNLPSCQKIINCIYNNPSVYLDRKFEVIKKIANSKIRKMSIDKEAIKESYIRLGSYTLVSKELCCSIATIMRRLNEYSLTKNLLINQ